MQKKINRRTLPPAYKDYRTSNTCLHGGSVWAMIYSITSIEKNSGFGRIWGQNQTSNKKLMSNIRIFSGRTIRITLNSSQKRVWTIEIWKYGVSGFKIQMKNSWPYSIFLGRTNFGIQVEQHFAVLSLTFLNMFNQNRLESLIFIRVVDFYISL